MSDLDRDESFLTRHGQTLTIALLVAALILGSQWLASRTQTARQETAQTQQQSDDLAARVTKACATTGEARDRLVAAGACQKAA